MGLQTWFTRITYGKSVSMASATTLGDAVINIPMSAGDKVRLWGDNTVYVGADGASYLNTNITCSAPHYVHGDIRSLLSRSNFPNVTSVSAWAFSGLFEGDTQMRSHPSIPLTMPATSVGDFSYSTMFNGCSGLVRAPALPATGLGTNCYENMFSSCTAFTEAPALPATSLAPCCYGAMFSGCTSLVSAPAIPATTLK